MSRRAIKLRPMPNLNCTRVRPTQLPMNDEINSADNLPHDGAKSLENTIDSGPNDKLSEQSPETNNVEADTLNIIANPVETLKGTVIDNIPSETIDLTQKEVVNPRKTFKPKPKPNLCYRRKINSELKFETSQPDNKEQFSENSQNADEGLKASVSSSKLASPIIEKELDKVNFDEPDCLKALPLERECESSAKLENEFVAANPLKKRFTPNLKLNQRLKPQSASELNTSTSKLIFNQSTNKETTMDTSTCDSSLNKEINRNTAFHDGVRINSIKIQCINDRKKKLKSKRKKNWKNSKILSVPRTKLQLIKNVFKIFKLILNKRKRILSQLRAKHPRAHFKSSPKIMGKVVKLKTELRILRRVQEKLKNKLFSKVKSVWRLKFIAFSKSIRRLKQNLNRVKKKHKKGSTCVRYQKKMKLKMYCNKRTETTSLTGIPLETNKVKRLTTNIEKKKSNTSKKAKNNGTIRINRGGIDKATKKRAENGLNLENALSIENTKKDDGALTLQEDYTDVNKASEFVESQNPSVPKIRSLYSRTQNTVKPNLATANRNVRPQQFTTTYRKLVSNAKAKFKERHGSSKPDHSKLTMLDLIYYNPPNSDKKNEYEVLTSKSDKDISPTDVAEEIVISNTSIDSCNAGDLGYESSSEPGRVVDQNGIPVPQLKILADGKIIIAPESLVIPESCESVNPESRPIIEENDMTRHKFTNRRKKTDKRKKWSFQETVQFYRILETTGSDFSAMEDHFPDRSRTSLKRKFKREEKLHGFLIDRIIGSKRNKVDIVDIEKELVLHRMGEDFDKSESSPSSELPEVYDVSKGVTEEMFLTKKEKRNLMKKQGKKKSTSSISNSDSDSVYWNCVLSNDGTDDASESVSEDTIGSPKKPLPKTKKKKQKIVRVKLKDYLQPDYIPPFVDPNRHTSSESSQQTETEGSVDLVSDEENLNSEVVSNNTPIVVITSIESAGMKYTKSVTFNPSNLNPVEINETIAHTNQTVNDHSSEIIHEIVNILSSDEVPLKAN